MKRFITTAIIFAAFISLSSSGLSAMSVDAETEGAVEKMVAEYVKKYPLTGMKRGLCVLPFAEDSSMAKDLGLGTTMRDIVSGTISESQVFFLVDRDTLESRMKEMELSMTGMVDEKSIISAGKQAGVNVFLTGSVSEVENQFQVTLKLVDSETGVVVSQGSFRIPRSQMERKHEQVAYGYIAQYGIGINWQTSYLFRPCSMENETMLNDVFVSYRPYLWLNLKLGVTHIYLEMWDDAKVNTSDLYPNYTGASIPTGYTNGKINQTAPYVGVEYNWLISPSFTIGFGVSATFFMPDTLRLEQIYTGNPKRKADFLAPGSATVNQSQVDVMNTMILEQTFDPAVMFRAEIKPQFFISPRAAIGIYLAAVYTTPLKVERADFNDGVAIYPNTSDGATDPSDWHCGFNAKQFGLDKNGNVEQDLALLGCAVGLSASFYF